MKRTIYEEISYPFNWIGQIELHKLKKDIEELEKLGATLIEINLDYNYGEPYIDITAYKKEIETEEQYQSRMSYYEEIVRQIKEKK